MKASERLQIERELQQYMKDGEENEKKRKE